MKNKKGFTTVELVVSFVLIAVISIGFFNTILSLQKQQQRNIAINQYKAFILSLNSSIQNDFLNDRIDKIEICGSNCYNITYLNNGEKQLLIDEENSIITYGSYKDRLPSDYRFIDEVEITSYLSDKVGFDSYIVLTITVKNDLENKIEKIKYMYQYDSDTHIVDTNL